MSPASNAAAFRSAQSAIGYYGDPTVTWSILLEAELTQELATVDLQARLAEFAGAHPRLGSAPTLVVAPDWPALRSDFADRPYDPVEPLVRVGLTTSGDRLLIAAHHGILDGIGLLAVLAAVVGAQLSSSARGVSASATTTPFPVSAAQRLAEAAFSPPSRLTPDIADDVDGDLLAAISVRGRVNTAKLVAAAARAAIAHGMRPEAGSRIVAAIGASKRAGSRPTAEHASTYLRVRVPDACPAHGVAEILRRTRPEPDFPAARGTFAPRLARLLSGRLGSTFLASNLGLVTGGPIRALRFHPAATGPAGVAFGLVSTPETSTLTIRTRRTAFSPDATAALLNNTASALAAD